MAAFIELIEITECTQCELPEFVLRPLSRWYFCRHHDKEWYGVLFELFFPEVHFR